jgi:hypothetical protein
MKGPVGVVVIDHFSGRPALCTGPFPDELAAAVWIAAERQKRVDADGSPEVGIGLDAMTVISAWRDPALPPRPTLPR